MRLIDADKAKAELLRIARDIHTIAVGFMTVLKLVIKVLLIGLIQFLQRKKNVIKDIG